MLHSILKPRIVVVGGGAGGLELVTRLGRKLGKKNRATISLIDSQLTHIWKPLLHEVAVGTLDSHQDEINYLTHAHHNGYEFQLGEMMGLDRQGQKIILAPMLNHTGEVILPQRVVSFDYLIIAVGSRANTFNVPGVDAHCFFLDTSQEAESFHQALVQKIIQVRQYESQTQDMPLSVTIIGAGASGVELAAEMVKALEQAKKIGLGPVGEKLKPKVTLIEAHERILPHLPKRLVKQVHAELIRLGIEIHTGQRVTQVTDTEVFTEDGLVVPSIFKVWVAGIKAHPWLAQLDDLEVNQRNQLVVKATMQTTVDDRIFAFGDCCALPLEGSKTVPPRAQAARQEALLLYRSMQGVIKGAPPLSFQYKDYGSLVNLSSANTIGYLMGKYSQSFMIEGKLARLMYLALYKLHQLTLYGFRNWILIIISAIISRRAKPRLKLH